MTTQLSTPGTLDSRVIPIRDCFHVTSLNGDIPIEVELREIEKILSATDDELTGGSHTWALYGLSRNALSDVEQGAKEFLRGIKAQKFPITQESGAKSVFGHHLVNYVPLNSVVLAEMKVMRSMFFVAAEETFNPRHHPDPDPFAKGLAQAFDKVYDQSQYFRGAIFAAMTLLARISDSLVRPEMAKQFAAKLIGVPDTTIS